jgi:hypothetical protein
MQGGRKERSRRTDIGTDDVRVVQPESISHTNDELRHRPRGQQCIAALGLSEAR